MSMFNSNLHRSIAVQSRALINCCLAEYYYARKDSDLKNMPRIFAIELTNYCNLSCAACPRAHMKRDVGFMDFGLFKTIIDQVKGHVGFIWLHNFGEPLFHPRIGEFIAYCARNNIRTGISTNATILDEKKAAMILNSGLDHIVIAIDGATKETYQKFRGGGDFEKVCNNAENFFVLKRRLKKTKPFTEVQLVRMDETETEAGAFKEKWSALADNVFIKDFCAWGDQVRSITGLIEKKPKYYAYRARRRPCMALWRDGVVLWNGDLVLCCMDYDGKMVLGNLRDERLEDIWNSKRISGLRREQIEENYDNPLCRDCSEWSGRQMDINFFRLKLFPYFKRLLRK